MKQRKVKPAPAGPEERGGGEANEKFVILFRHGIAEPHEVAKPDEERSLTKDGHARMKEIGRGLAALFPKADAIFTSPLVRAVQTALWISKGYKERLTVQTAGCLIPGSSTDDLRAFLASIGERRVILVGHEPNLSTNCLELAGLQAHAGFELKKGGCYGIRIDREGKGTLEWMLAPKVLRKIR